MVTIRMTIDWTFDENGALVVAEDPVDDITAYTIDSILDVAEQYGIEEAVEAIRDTADDFAGRGIESEYYYRVEQV